MPHYYEKWESYGLKKPFNGNRIHAFGKGWGTIVDDGDGILWDWWRPFPTPKRKIKFDKITPPKINIPSWPEIKVGDKNE